MRRVTRAGRTERPGLQLQLRRRHPRAAWVLEVAQAASGTKGYVLLCGARRAHVVAKHGLHRAEELHVAAVCARVRAADRARVPPEVRKGRLLGEGHRPHLRQPHQRAAERVDAAALGARAEDENRRLRFDARGV
eukprot:4528027-Pleurochrysis_carterae.AAC.1